MVSSQGLPLRYGLHFGLSGTGKDARFCLSRAVAAPNVHQHVSHDPLPSLRSCKQAASAISPHDNVRRIQENGQHGKRRERASASAARVKGF